MSVELTWLGHATWLLQTDQHRIIIDPFLNDNPSATVKADEIEVDQILITHGHGDHVADATSIAKRCNATVVANYEIANWFTDKQGVEKTVGMNHGGSTRLPFGEVKMTIAWHSSQLPDGSGGGNPGGFIVATGGQRIYFAGDTALFSDMQLIAAGGLDAAILPIGDLFTMGIADSVEAAKLLKADKVLPAHYNTWPPIEQDPAAWAKTIEQQTDSQACVLEVNGKVTL